jgi:hypothetical protein
VKAFPRQGLRESSLRFVGESLLGHRFLGSGFVVDYETESGDFRAFIADAADPAAVQKMLEEYRALLEKKGVSYTDEEGTLSFLDPYHKYEGRLHMRRSGTRLFGVFHDDPEVANRFLKAVEANLAAPAE